MRIKVSPIFNLKYKIIPLIPMMAIKALIPINLAV